MASCEVARLLTVRKPPPSFFPLVEREDRQSVISRRHDSRTCRVHVKPRLQQCPLRVELCRPTDDRPTSAIRSRLPATRQSGQLRSSGDPPWIVCERSTPAIDNAGSAPWFGEIVRDPRDIGVRKNRIHGSLKSNLGEGFRLGPLGARESDSRRIGAGDFEKAENAGFRRQALVFVGNDQGIYLDFPWKKAWKRSDFLWKNFDFPWKGLEKFGRAPDPSERSSSRAKRGDPVIEEIADRRRSARTSKRHDRWIATLRSR